MRRMLLVTAILNSSMLYATALKPPLDLDLNASSQEYRTLLNRQGLSPWSIDQDTDQNIDQNTEQDDDAASDQTAYASLQLILQVGARNLDWVDQINSQRPPAEQLQLSTPATQPAYPVDAPNISNEAIILRRYDAWLAATATDIKAVLLDGRRDRASLPSTPPVSDEEFLQTARQIDMIYQAASRWLLEQPYLNQYRQLAKYDVRGYLALQQDVEIDSKLRNWEQRSPAEQEQLRNWLIMQCYNDEAYSLSRCRSDWNRALQLQKTLRDSLLDFHRSHQIAAKDLYESFFTISTSRRDVIWPASSPQLMQVPFRDPRNPTVLNWLRDNIQDEWRWGDWQLELKFMPSSSSSITRVVFEPGATPNVNEIAGNIITMDANRSLDEYNSRWTIRHEYGHVLGFDDCYLEFYDDAQQAMVSYQLDITNLMCSRRGHIQQQHVDELRRMYFR